MKPATAVVLNQGSAEIMPVLGLVSGVATRDRFEQPGVATYLSPTDCGAKDNSGDGDGVRSTALTMDDVHREPSSQPCR
ncbi:hypothetical protein [Saccharothrix xinjiangensis]|uniref:Uncharacterized protein n=1 Tax=Saccharothrix xinjiangensis TaxID=204798 RepID=A0ABV9Y3C0_9PSEU